MARTFCGYCGLAITWPVPASLQTGCETRQRCSGCGSELYRNPEVYVLCLGHRGDGIAVSRAIGQLVDRETLQEAASRLLARYRLPTSESAAARLFGIVSDFDSDRVYLVFHAQIVDPGADGTIGEPASWVAQLETALRAEFQSAEHHVHSGVVHDGQLRLTAQKPG